MRELNKKVTSKRQTVAKQQTAELILLTIGKLFIFFHLLLLSFLHDLQEPSSSFSLSVILLVKNCKPLQLTRPQTMKHSQKYPFFCWWTCRVVSSNFYVVLQFPPCLCSAFLSIELVVPNFNTISIWLYFHVFVMGKSKKNGFLFTL